MKVRHGGIVVLPWLALACGEPAAPAPRPTGDKPRVCTDLYPLLYFAQRIAGDRIEVECVVARGQDPLHWDPDAAAIQRLQDADLILLNGAQAERWTFAVSLPVGRAVETAQGFAEQWRKIERSVTHSHGQGGTHTHEGIDPHTWMDPLLAKEQARAVHGALRRLLPDAHAALDKGMAALAKDLDDLLARLSAAGPAAGEVLVASHAAYDYVAARLGWRVVNLELDPGAPLSEAALAAARQALAGLRARCILWEAEPAAELARQVREQLGLESVLWSPGETLPAPGEPDWLTGMRAAAERLHARR